MGKVISTFMNGFAGAVSRQADAVIKSFKYAGDNPLPFGVPVFLNQTANAVEELNTNTVTDNFLGFTVRTPDIAPASHVSGQFASNQDGAYTKENVVDVLERGSMTVEITGNCRVAAPVYVRRSDNALVCLAGESGTTVQLPGVYISKAKDGNGMAEIVISKRNLI